MALPIPPAVIHIKRKRDEAPVDVLVLENEHRSDKRRVTDFVFRRLRDVSATFASPHPPNNGIPTVITTLPGEEKRDPYALRVRETYTPSIPSQPDEPRCITAIPFRRRFHLSTPASSTDADLSTSPARKRKRAAEIALFVERGKEPRPAREVRRLAERVGTLSLELGVQLRSETVERQARSLSPRKRPVTTAAERKWRMRSTSRRREGDERVGMREEGLEKAMLVEKMKAFAQEVESAEQSPPSVASTEEHGEGMELDDRDYIHETYVRHLVPAGSVDTQNAGQLVIDEAAQELWETYLSDDEDEEKFDTDDEDSNAEDYYGADYPEDEVESDDEYDINPHQYSNNDSDADYGFSDAEDGDAEPQTATKSGTGIAGDFEMKDY
ncbi:hypothetical protein EJ06DRAFT_403656 [Trichodelitschia bisporula]|uniref:Transcription factor Iwr1 domain-containing protein n=1 Tax=Trichodelitschia bisporula TaxID=703511 RepID=A0A6G1HXZ0_9PEZI|nr:hypothetical protein EJ06DRAFT_403656 [Trichodelitschia bisporula]